MKQPADERISAHPLGVVSARGAKRGHGVATLNTLGCQLDPFLFAQKPKVVPAFGASWPFQDSERAVMVLPLVVKLADQAEVVVLCAKFTTVVHDEIVAADLLVTLTLAQ